MRWLCRLNWQDRDGHRGTCATRIEGLSTVAALVAFANAFGDAVQALSSARLESGLLTTRVQLGPSAPAGPTSNVARKLLVISRNSADRYGTLAIPSPRDLPWEPQGAYSGFRLKRSDAPAPLAAAVNTALPLLVRPDNTPMPTEDWVIALITE